MALLMPCPGPRIPRPPWLRAACGIICAVLLAGLPSAGSAQAGAAREYQVKAVFLYNFTQFVEWPSGTFATPEDPIVVGVLGHDPFGPVLDHAMQGEQSGPRTIVTRRFRHMGEIDHCHVLFISTSEEARLERVLAALENRPILTVTDGEGFARRGVMIRMATENRRIRLKINLAAARRAGLVFSSKLLRPAEIIDDGETPP
jgi:hypothetical protein